jgi:hypothetical protein
MFRSKGHWRIVSLLIAFALPSQVSNAQQQVPPGRTGVFTASDGAFQFSYPKDFQVCTQGKVAGCNRFYIPVCQEDAVVCVIHAAAEFKDTSFGAASFEVREIFQKGEAETPDVCATPYPRKEIGTSDWPEFLISAEHPQEMIGDVEFIHGISGGVATGKSIDIDLYRAFHKGRCFELSVSHAGTNPGISDPPSRTLTAAEYKKLHQSMSQILHSFRFSGKD